MGFERCFFLLGDTLPAADTLESIGICCVTAAVTRDRYVCHDLLMALDMCYPVCCYGHHEVPRRMPDHRPRLEDMHDSMLFLRSLESICTAPVSCNRACAMEGVSELWLWLSPCWLCYGYVIISSEILSLFFSFGHFSATHRRI